MAGSADGSHHALSCDTREGPQVPIKSRPMRDALDRGTSKRKASLRPARPASDKEKKETNFDMDLGLLAERGAPLASAPLNPGL